MITGFVALLWWTSQFVPGSPREATGNSDDDTHVLSDSDGHGAEHHGERDKEHRRSHRCENQTNTHLKRLLILDSKGTQDETPFNTLLLRYDFRSNENHAGLNGLLVIGRKYGNRTPRRQLTFRWG